MLQRIQTVYLFLGAVVLGSLFFLNSLWSSAPAESYGWYVPAVIGLVAVTALVGLGAIFLYNDRPTQRTVVVGAQVLTFVLAVVMYGGFYLTDTLTVRADGAIRWAKVAVLVAPAVAYVLFWLARRGIDHDIELVKSMDRLR